jgi:hypothetical protein
MAIRRPGPALSEDVSGDFILSGKPPLYYSLQVDELHLLLLHVVDQDLPREVREFMQKDSAQAPSDALRLCIGHVPLVSMMGRTNESYRDELGKLLVQQPATRRSSRATSTWCGSKS